MKVIQENGNYLHKKKSGVGCSSGVLKLLTYLLLTTTILTGCGGDNANSTRNDDSSNTGRTDTPFIEHFTTTSTEITDGDSVTLVPYFENGSGSIDHDVGPVTSGQPVTLYLTNTSSITLTVTNEEGVKVSRSVSVVVNPHPIDLTIISPNGNTSSTFHEDDILDLSIWIQTDLEITEVSASLDGTTSQVPYIRSLNCSLDGCLTSQYIANISLKDLNSGEHTLIVTATESEGGSVSKRRKIILDKKPVLTIHEPAMFSVASLNMAFSASCTDDNGDCEITLHPMRTSSTASEEVLARGVNTLSEEVDLSRYDGQSKGFGFKAVDSAGNTALVPFTIYVEQSPKLKTVKSFPGAEVMDFDGERVLLRTLEQGIVGLKVYNLTSNTQTKVNVLPEHTLDFPETTEAGRTVDKPQVKLTPSGVVYESLIVDEGNEDNTRRHAMYFESTTSTLTELSDNAIYGGDVRVAGDYIAWVEYSNGQGDERVVVYHRKLSSGDVKQIPISGGGQTSWGVNSLALANNGLLAASSWVSGLGEGAELFTFDSAGTKTLLRQHMHVFNVVTDGESILYSSRPHRHDDDTTVFYHNGETETTLDYYLSFTYEQEYFVSNNWVVYKKWASSNNRQYIWRRDPWDNLNQLTFSGEITRIENLNPEGEVMINVPIQEGSEFSNTRQLIDVDGNFTKVGSAMGKSLYINDEWYILLANSLLKVE